MSLCCHPLPLCISLWMCGGSSCVTVTSIHIYDITVNNVMYYLLDLIAMLYYWTWSCTFSYGDDGGPVNHPHSVEHWLTLAHY